MSAEAVVPAISSEAAEAFSLRLIALKSYAALKNSPDANKLLVHIYVASSLELYLNYMEKMNVAMAVWGNGITLEMPRDLPAYYSVCGCCGAKCGEITMLKRHKLLQEVCGQCPPALYNTHSPITGTYAMEQLAKLMNSTRDAVEHNICEALIARRASYDVHSKKS